MDITIAEPNRTASGVWSVGVWPEGLVDLVRAVDPAVPFVIVEDHGAIGWEWLTARVPLNTAQASTPKALVVRRLTVDLLMTPAQLLEAAADLQAATEGRLFLWQCSRKPPHGFVFGRKDDAARVAAMKGLDIRLVIDLPHTGEVAVLTAPTQAILEEALGRLRT